MIQLQSLLFPVRSLEKILRAGHGADAPQLAFIIQRTIRGCRCQPACEKYCINCEWRMVIIWRTGIFRSSSILLVHVRHPQMRDALWTRFHLAKTFQQLVWRRPYSRSKPSLLFDSESEIFGEISLAATFNRINRAVPAHIHFIRPMVRWMHHLQFQSWQSRFGVERQSRFKKLHVFFRLHVHIRSLWMNRL